MNNRYKLKLSKDKTINLDLSFFRIREGYRPRFIDIVRIIGGITWFLFFLFIFSSHIFDQSFADVSILLWVYIFVVVLLAVQVLKKVFLKGEYLPTIPYDIILLTFTTLVALSLFTSTLGQDADINIWGGGRLRVFSGLSLITFWFLYYLIVINYSSKEKLNNFINLISVAPLIASSLNILGYFDLGYYYGMAMTLLLPGWLVLLLSNKKHKWLYLVNSVLSLYFLSQFESSYLFFSVGLTLLSGVLILLYKNKSNLKSLFSNFDKGTEQLIKRKLSFNQLVSMNFDLIYSILGSLLSLITIIWTFTRGKQGVTDYLRAGIETLGFDSGVKELLLGGGLISFEGSFATQLIHVYGVIPFIVLIALFILVAFELKKYIIETDDSESVSKAFFILLSFASMSIYLFLTPVNDIVYVLFWVLLAIAGAFNQVYLKKQVFKFSDQLIIFSKEKGYYKYIQLVISLLIVIGTMYFLRLILDIKEFLI